MGTIKITESHFELVDELRKLLTEQDGFDVHLVFDGNFTDPKFQNMCIHISDDIFNKTWVILLDGDNNMLFTIGEKIRRFSNKEALALFIKDDLSKETQ